MFVGFYRDRGGAKQCRDLVFQSRTDRLRFNFSVMTHIGFLMVRLAVAVILGLISFQSRAGGFEVDLNGFRLQQLLFVVEPSLGRPFETIDAGSLVLNAYSIDQDAYMVVGHLKKYPNNISLLQLTGVTPKALPFKGLALGDSQSKVIDVLGKPDRVEKIQSPNVTKFSYEGRNYTLEIDDKDRLYSIQLFTNSDLMSKTDGTDGEWADFKAAVLSKNLAALLEMMKPDVEIYRGGKTLSINTPFSAFAANPNKEFVSALIAPTGSVLQQITQTEPVRELRLTEKIGAGVVFKFPNGKILQEIVFFPFNGKYRVYEIAFREGVK